MKYIVFNKEGRILRFGNCPPFAVKFQAGDGEFVIEGDANDIDHFVKEGAIHAKDRLPVKRVENSFTVPLGTSVYVDDNFIGVTDTGVVDLIFDDHVSEYKVKFSLFPFLDVEEVVINEGES